MWFDSVQTELLLIVTSDLLLHLFVKSWGQKVDEKYLFVNKNYVRHAK